jgi:hypothetical protein
VQRKDAERQQARRLRAEGMSVKKIAARLGVAASSVSVWTRDVAPAPPPPKPRKPPGRPRSQPEPLPGAPTKYCGSCDRVLPLTAFNRAGDGHQYWCRDCFIDYFRERGDRHRNQSRAARERRKAVARALVREHLAAHPCVDCGEDDLLVLEFDHHRADKEENVSRLVSAGALRERLEREIARCEVVCVNCHRRRTATRAGSFRATGTPAKSWTAPQLRNAVFVVEVLRASGCCDCGERDPVVLDFDHVLGKQERIARLVSTSSITSLRAEIERCVVRCANCHRVRTLTISGAWRAEDHWAMGLHSNPSEI